MLVRTASVALVHTADKAAENGNIAGVERAHYLALVLQGLRIAVPAALLLAIPAQSVQHALGLMPDWLNHGMVVGGPLLVSDKKDYYEIIAGERRWRAAKLAGLTEMRMLFLIIS